MKQFCKVNVCLSDLESHSVLITLPVSLSGIYLILWNFVALLGPASLEKFWNAVDRGMFFRCLDVWTTPEKLFQGNNYKIVMRTAF